MISIQQALALAWQHFQAGQWQQAEELYLQILQSDPQQIDALHLLGVLTGQTGRMDQAMDYLQAVLRLQPGLAAAHANLGNVYSAQRKLPEAVASYEQAVRLQPGSAVAHNNLGNALREQGRLAEAVAHLQQALRLQPDSAAAHHNLGLAYQTQGKLDEAEASYRQAVRLQPDHAEAHLNLGTTLLEKRQPESAMIHLQQVLRLKPNNAEAYQGLGIALADQGKIVEAAAHFRNALRFAPNAAHIHSNLIVTLNYHPGYDAAAIYEECRCWNQRYAEPLRQLIQPHLNDPSPERRLRVGYISPDFREHVDAFFTIPLLSNHDHRQYEIVLYAGVAHPDSVTEQLRGYADAWRSTVGLSDQQVADLVRGDGIDILVDMKLHTANNRLLMFARKPAPVQVAWLGYPGTTGLTTIDYRLTDPYLDPPGRFDAFSSEEPIRLPDTFWCYDPRTDQPAVNALPARETGRITFGCLNNFRKVNDDCLVLWAGVLRATPRSQLLLLAPRGSVRERVLARLEQEGIASSRVEFVDGQPRAEYLKLYHRMDLGLDPFPCNGHTTSLDAFWMGVPTITLVGKTVVGRATWSQLSNLGLQGLAAETQEQYVELAAQLADDLPWLQELRGTLRQRMQKSPLMDGNRFARHVEQAYRQMWRRWCQQPGPP